MNIMRILKSVAIVAIVMFNAIIAVGQTFNFGTDLGGGSGYTYTNYPMVDRGSFWQTKIQENFSTAAGSRKWEFNADSYFNTWRAPSGTPITMAGHNQIIVPNAATASAFFRASFGGGDGARFQATTNGNYYTINITAPNGGSGDYANQHIQFLETSYNPVNITAVAQAAGPYATRVVTITTSATPNANEFIYVRYSTNSFASSTLVQATGSGTTWTATIPFTAAAGSFYVYSSVKTLSQINSDVTTFGQFSHDLATLELNNNGGANYSFAALTGPIIVTSTLGTAANTPTTYATLTAAFTAINGGVIHLGVITIAVSGDTNEGTGTAALNQVTGVTSIGIQPVGGAARTITGATTTANPMINFNGADNVTIDGLNTGGNSLTISNTTVSALSGTATIRFIGDATNNTITNCSVLGSGTMAVGTNGGVIFFSTGTTTGNDNNTISNCNIGAAGTTITSKGIYGNGTSTNQAVGNSGIVITNCNFFDCFAAAASSAGIYTAAGCNTWTISGNRFYQTATRTWTAAAQHSAIWIIPATATTGAQGFTIANNIIGYASATQTGTYTLTGAFASSFVPIFYNGITGSALTTISGNTIANISITGVTTAGTSTAAPFRMIHVENGLVDVTNNTIGSNTATGNIVATTTATAGTEFYGIYNFSGDNTTISGNTIGGITFTTSATTSSAIIYGIRINTGNALTSTIQNNIIGGTIANSIQNNANSNTAQIIGILNGNSISTITGNTIRNCTTINGTGSTTNSSLIGISVNATSTNHTVTNNTIHSLSNTLSTATSPTIIGIRYASSTGTNLVDRNNIHSLSLSATGSGNIVGINAIAGNATYANNMIRLGYNAAGTSLTNAYLISGILEAAGTNNFYHNSIYIGGTGVGTTANNTFAFNSSVTINTRNIINNIFSNERSNTTTGGGHYAITVGGSAANPAGLTSNYNLLYAPNTGGVLGRFNATNYTTLAAWRTATGQDNNSISSNPQFINPTGSAATGDLHISPTLPTSIEGGGTTVAAVTIDFDNETRSTLSPVDIGADAGNFTGLDVSGPNIAYSTLISNVCGYTAPTLPAVTITDATGLPNTPSLATSALRPRIYFRKNAGAWFSNEGTYVSGTATNSVWDFTPNYTLIGGVTGNDVIQYYVIAEDQLANVSANPGAGIVATSVLTVTTHPTSPNSYTVRQVLNGTYTVGVGGDFTTLTAAVAVYNNACLTGPVVFSLIDNNYSTSETFPIQINVNADASSINTLTIKPATGVTTTITGSNATNLFRLEGADYITFDGSNTVAGTTKDLTISNTNTGGTAFTFINDATNNAIRNTILQSVNNNNNTGTILFSTGTTIGNDNNTISNCDLRDGATTPWNAIYSGGSTGSATLNNSGITITGCNIFNYFNATGVQAGVNLGLGNNTWTISNNKFYQTNARVFTGAGSSIGILISNTNAGSGGHTISGNTIGYASNTGTGVYAISGSTCVFTGIDVNTEASEAGAVSVIQNNIINGVTHSSSNGAANTASAFAAIKIRNGLWNATGNTIGDITGATGLTTTNSNTGTATEAFGILNYGAQTTTISNNTVSSITATNSSTGAMILYAIRCNTASGVTATISNNTIGGSAAPITSTATGTASRVIGISGESAATTIASNTVSNLNMNAANTGTTTSAGAIGILLSATGASSHNIRNNVVHSIQNTAATGAVVVSGIVYNGFTGTNTIEKNFVHSLNVVSSTGVINGMDFSSSNASIVKNNFIRLGVDASGNSITNPCVITGLRKSGGGAQEFYFNSVYIGGTGVASSAQTSSAFLRTIAGTVTMRSNILANVRSNATTGGPHYAINLNNTTNFTANNNVYLYSGTGGIFAFNGTANVANYSAAWLASDALSRVGNPNFVNPTGSAALVDLHINPVGGSAAESAGAEITGITDDYDAPNTRPAGGYPLGGQVNGGGTAPDAGADEGDFTPGGDNTAPAFSYTPITSPVCDFGNISINNVTITDATGLNASPTLATSTLRPRIYYRKNAGTWFSNGGTYVSGTATNSVWDFTINVTDMGGVTGGDAVSYYIIAQDDATPINIASLPSAGLVASDVNTVTTHPTTPNVYSVVTPLAGTYTVGATGNYATLADAINAYNTTCIGGPVVFSLIDNSYSVSTTLTINSNIYQSSTNTLTIKPAPGVSPIISGAIAGAIFRIDQADYVTIDGSNSTTINTVCPLQTASRDLTIRNTNSGTTSAVIWIQSAGSINTGATNNTIKNCIISGSSNTGTLVGIGSGSGTISAASVGIDNDNNRIENNLIQGVQIGVFSQGASATNENTGTVIQLNEMTGSGTASIGRIGVYIGFEDGAVIRANRISNVSGSSSSIIGIAAGIQTVSTTADAGNGVVNTQITENVINNITASATAVSGIAVGSSTETSATSITNNMIGGVLYTGTTSSQIGSNIYVANKAGNTFNIDNNTIHMFGSVTSTESKNHGVTVSTSSNIAGVVNVRNNIFSNTVNNTNGKTTCIAVGFGGTPPFSALNFNFNRFYLNGTNTFIGGFSGLTSGGLTTYATLPAWQSAISEDANSTVGLVTFVSNTNLHIDVNVGTNFLLDGTATNLSLASDIDCDIRTNPYDVGADEFIVPNCDLVDAGTITSAAAFVCGSATTTISSTGYTLPYTGITYQWEYSADGSTGWSPISGATNPDLLTTPVLTADGYFRLSITCSFSTNTDVSNVIMIDYRAIPTASASSNGPICAGQTLNLTGSTDIGTSFAWSGPNSFTSTDQNPSISSATVAATGSYTFIATANGCSSSIASVSVLVNASPATVTVTPASASICTGSSQVLTASGGITSASTTVFSGTINQSIPDNSTTGITNTIAVSGIPAGATITGMAVTLNITHTFPGDIVMNLRAPNNNVLNLINSNGDGGDNFTNTVISSAGINQLNTSASPYTGTFAATAASGILAATGQTANVTVWTSLYGTPNGNYVLSLRDDANLDTGTLNNWSITVFYSEPATYVWSPSTGLSATTGASVTASPTGNQTYTATVTNGAGCSSVGTADIIVNPRPTGSISGTATICASSPTDLTLTVTGTGTISGTLSTGQTFSGTAPTIVVSVSPSSTTTYTIATLVDANCSANAGDLSGSAVITTQPNETFYQDLDGDGFGNQSVTITTCVQPVGYVPAPVGDLNFDGQPDFDCNDTNEDVNPGADEICSPEDDNCDGFINEGYATITYYQDLDGDTFGNPAVFVTTCALPPLGYVLNNTDCNDNSAAARPNATEICDGIDNDCDTQIDEGCGGPINDNRFTALIVFPNNFGQCSNNTGTLLGATVSAEAQSTCVTGQDVWYYFTATSNGVSIIVNSSVNNILVELQTDAGVLMDVENAQSGIGNERMNFSGLIPGNTYYLAIRNFNSAQGVGGPFSFCVQRLFGSSCDLATPSPSLCAAFKATFTNANQYIYHFGSTVVNGPYAATVAGSGNTLLPLASVPGLTYGMTVTVSVDAVYALPNGLGVMENITVPGLSSCTFTTAPQPNIYVRAIDSCPNAKSLNAIIRAEPNICGQIIDYEWEFTEVLPNPGLPVTAFRGAADRFWRISWIPGVVPGGQYSVRIRPIFAGNVPGAWSTSPSCIRVIGAAVSVKEPIVVNQQYAERSLVTEGMDMDFSIFPNPTNGDAVTIVGTSTIEGSYQIRITDALGKIVFTDKIYREQGAFNHVIVFEQRLGAGLYMIEWITPDNLKTTEKLVVQN
jgi:subtilisin-like proprotein convertase family protein